MNKDKSLQCPQGGVSPEALAAHDHIETVEKTGEVAVLGCFPHSA